MVIRRDQWHPFPFVLHLLAAVATTRASLTNRTIDDLDGDSATGVKPQYAPSVGWNQGSQCPGCFVQLDSNEVFHGTWMDGTVPADDTTEPWTITMSFEGTAIYVFNALANSISSTRTDQNITFFLDGQQAGTFVHAATSSTEIDYRVQVFARNGLTNGSHTLVVQPEPNSNILFDFAMYTFDDGADATEGPTSASTTDTSTATTPPSSSETVAASSASNVTTIVPAVVGVVALIAILAALVFFLRRRRRRRRRFRSGPRLILDADLENTYEKGPEHTAGHSVPGLPTTGITGTAGDNIPSAGAPVNANSGYGAPHTYPSLASPPLSLPPSKRSPGVPMEPNTTLQTELAALRAEVARLRQEQADAQSSMPAANAAGSRPSLPEKARHSPTRSDVAQSAGSELAALQEEVRRLRTQGEQRWQAGTDSEVLSPSEDAPPRYEG